ncbi:MAG: hypothetical protein R2819_06935 [Allomuricauda sp.]
MRLKLRILVAVLFSGLYSFSQNPTGNTSGESISVGYTLIDVNRPGASYYQDSLKNDKPIPISLWFPLEHGDQPKMTYADYAKGISNESTQEENFNRYVRMLASFGQDSVPIQQPAFQALLGTNTKAVYTVDFPNPKHPLLLLLGGHPLYFLELAEAIAEQGYVVASIPRLGMEQGQRLPFDTTGAEEYQKDLAFVIDYLSKNEAVDKSNVHFVVWSFEGVPAFEYARTNKNVKGFISLDSSLGYGYGPDLITDKIHFYHSEINFPVIHFTGPSMDHGKDLSLLEALGKGSSSIEINKDFDLGHGQFTSMGSITSVLVQSREVDPVYTSLVARILFQLRSN